MNKFTTIITSLVSLILVISFSNPVFADGIKGNGNVTTDEREIAEFSGIKVNGAYTIYLSQEDDYSLKVVADENLQKIIKTEVRNNTLYVTNDESIRSSKKMELHIGFKHLDFIKSNGAISLKSDDVLRFDEFRVELNGASSAKLELTANKLVVDNSGASSISLEGKVKYLDIDISGAGSVNAEDLKAQVGRIDISGVGSGKVYVEEKLKVSISGIGSVKYKGDPTITSDISFLGVLKKF